MTYNSPFGPTAGTAPSTVLSESTQSPANFEIRFGIDHDSLLLLDFAIKIVLESVEFLVSYLSNCVLVN